MVVDQLGSVVNGLLPEALGAGRPLLTGIVFIVLVEFVFPGQAVTATLRWVYSLPGWKRLSVVSLLAALMVFLGGGSPLIIRDVAFPLTGLVMVGGVLWALFAEGRPLRYAEKWLADQDGISLITLASLVGVIVTFVNGYSPFDAYVVAVPFAGIIVVALALRGNDVSED